MTKLNKQISVMNSYNLNQLIMTWVLKGVHISCKKINNDFKLLYFNKQEPISNYYLSAFGLKIKTLIILNKKTPKKYPENVEIQREINSSIIIIIITIIVESI